MRWVNSGIYNAHIILKRMWVFDVSFRFWIQRKLLVPIAIMRRKLTSPYLDFLRIGGVLVFFHVVWVSLSFWHDSIPPRRGNILLFYASPNYVTAYVNSQTDTNNLTQPYCMTCIMDQHKTNQTGTAGTILA